MAGATEIGKFSEPPFTDKCLLHVPHKDVGSKLVALMTKLDVDGTHTAEIKSIGTALNENFQEIERWADMFYKDCICDCIDVGGS